MKIVKKTLIITSALALGLLVAGCGKKSKVINKDNTYTKSGLSRYDKYDTFTNKLNVRVKSHTVLSNNRVVWYVTTNDETIIYDFMADKVLYKTFDKVSGVTAYINNNVYLISFNDTDNSKMLIASDGTVLANKDKYSSIAPKIISSEENKKKNNYSEMIFYVLTKKSGDSSVVKYYKLVKAGVKDYKGELMEDLSLNYTLTEISEDDARKYKKGDLYPKSENEYYYNVNNMALRFYEEASNKTILNMFMNDDDTDYEVIMLKDKALVQFYNKTKSSDNYDVCNYELINYNTQEFGYRYYNIETYVVDLKKASYSKLDNFKYFLGYADDSSVYVKEEDEYPSYYIIDGARLIENKFATKTVEVIIDNDAKVVQDDQKLIYLNTYYYDLGNGNYLVDEDGTTYLTDKNGSIKKVFDGYSRVLYDSKVIIIYDTYHYNELKFIDFKGNYITDKAIKCDNGYIVSDKEVYYYDVNDNSKLHLIKLDNASIVSDEIVDYEVSTSTTINTVTYVNSEKDRYYSMFNYYFTAKPIDADNDEVTDYINVTYYTIDGTELGTTSKVNKISFRSTYAFDGKSNYAAISTVDKTTTDYILQIDIIAKD